MQWAALLSWGHSLGLLHHGPGAQGLWHTGAQGLWHDSTGAEGLWQEYTGAEGLWQQATFN